MIFASLIRSLVHLRPSESADVGWRCDGAGPDVGDGGRTVIGRPRKACEVGADHRADQGQPTHDVGKWLYAARAASRANPCGDPEPHTEPSLRERLRRPWTPP